MEVLGILMLSGILPVLIWLVVSILLIKFVIRPAGSSGRRVLIKLVVFPIMFLLPFADEIMGQTYLNYLCKTQGGFKVYQTVELPNEYWDENGDPLFIIFPKFSLHKVNGTLDFSRLPEYGIDREDIAYSPILGIQLFRHWYYEKKTRKMLAEGRFFTYSGGWLSRTFTSKSGVSCDTTGQPNTKANILSVFVSKKHRKLKGEDE
jgi:hypothetical protein